MALEHGVADLDAEALHHAAGFGVYDMLHLHGFHDQHLPAAPDLIAGADVEGDDGALHGRGHRGDAGRQFLLHQCQGCRGGGGARCVGLAMVQHGQRVDGIDLGAGQRLGGGGRRARFACALLALGQGAVLGGTGQTVQVVIDEARIEGAIGERGVGKQVAQEVQVRGHALDAGFTQRPVALAHRRGVAAVPGVDDQFGQQ